jgi:hypothetical protein
MMSCLLRELRHAGLMCSSCQQQRSSKASAEEGRAAAAAEAERGPWQPDQGRSGCRAGPGSGCARVQHECTLCAAEQGDDLRLSWGFI